jgi:hypothetical protein
MIEVISKEAPAEMYKNATCERCGWTYRYLPKCDVTTAYHSDMAGGDVWYYIPCLNENCINPNWNDKRSKIEVPKP